jgi:salicylate hydroxylase
VAQPVSEYRDGRTGAVLRRIERQASQQVYGAPHLRMHRWDLQAALIDGLATVAPEALRQGWRLETIAQNADTVTLGFDGGRMEEADLVIGADGVHSVVRERLFPATPAEFVGHVAWRGLVPTADLPAHLCGSVVAFGFGRMINRYAVRRGELMNLVCFARRDAWEAEGWTIAAPLSELQAEFADFDAETRALIDRIPDDRLFKWGLFGRAPLASWVRGRVVLLGDAAHPMLPFLGQGAAMAIEDAYILARALALEHDVDRGLARFQAARLERVGHVTQRAAKQAGMFYGDPGAYSLERDLTDKPIDLFTYDAVAVQI